MKISHLGHHSHLMSKLKSIFYDCSGSFKRFMFLTRVKLRILRREDHFNMISNRNKIHLLIETLKKRQFPVPALYLLVHA